MTTKTNSPRWAARKLACALQRSGHTSASFAELLRTRGFNYTASGVRTWCRVGDKGPKHPAVRALVWALLGEVKL